MMTANSTGIVIEIEEKFINGGPEKLFDAFCSDCKRMTPMASTTKAAELCGRSEREIFRLIESRQIHFVETDRTYVCLDSLGSCLGN